MSQLPHLISGDFGPINFDDMNDVFRHVERDASVEVDEGAGDREQRRTPFIAKVVGLNDDPDAPFDKILRWEEQQLGEFDPVDGTQYLFGPNPNGRKGGSEQDQGGDLEGQFIAPGFFFTAPFGLMHVVTDGDGRKKYVWQAAQQAFKAVVLAVNGGPFNVTYNVVSADRAIRADDLTPITRWAGLNYNPLPIQSPVELMVSRDIFGGGEFVIDLIAHGERPEIIDCNAKGAAGFSDSLIGL